MLDEIQKAALPIFLSVLRASADHGGHFRLLVTSKIDDDRKPLLIVGSAHGQVEDGHLIAVLNPTKALADASSNLIAGCAYTPGGLKDIVSGKCDAMVELWIDAYKNDKVTRLASRRPPRFE